MYKRLLHIDINSQHSYLILGARGTGKTTWVKQAFPTAHYIDLLDQTIYLELAAAPGKLKEFYPRDAQQWIIIDEIQKIPMLLNEVHRAIESERRRFILTGSSARALRKKGVNLLAGRALQTMIHPLTAKEEGEHFNLKMSLQFGQLPAAKSHEMPKAYLSSYVTTYLREEVLQEGLTRNIQTFHRFLEAASFSHGTQIEYASIARELGIDNKTVSAYYDILEDLLIGHRLPVFNKRAKRRLSHAPKFYFFDVGIYQTIRPRGPLDSNQEINGHALESFLLQEMRAINDYFNLEYAFFFWRTSSQYEVDFIAYGPHGLYAIEVKSRDRYDSSDLKGLKVFKEDYPQANCYLLYLGEQERMVEDIQILPFTKTIKQLDKLLTAKKI
ncbi:MAG: ATP-binding protein [Gammaproteobacteria bacterium]|nr:ATP-binding protein [Gammaproteobacteria bacterium]